MLFTVTNDRDWSDEKLKERGANDKSVKLNILEAIQRLPFPIKGAPSVVKLFFDVPTETKILLCVDELSKAGSGKYTPVSMLRHLTQKYLDVDPNLFLSVTTYGAVNLVKFSTESNRPLLLQTLGPIWHENGFDKRQIPLLPALLQPFYDAVMRKNLPYVRFGHVNDPLELYKEVSHWILRTAGHPRRVEELFREVRKFSLSDEELLDLRKQKYNGGREAGERFVMKLQSWLNEGNRRGHIQAAIVNAVHYPDNLNGLLVGRSVADMSEKQRAKKVGFAVRSLAIDAACAFRVPDSKETADEHRVTLQGSSTGYCQFLRQSGSSSGEGNVLVHAFIPLPVLNVLKSGDVTEPCGQALLNLKIALNSYQSWDESGDDGVVPALQPASSGGSKDKGKPFEKVFEAALLLYARAIPTFRTSSLCDDKHCGQERAELHGGETVEHWTDIERFPKTTGPSTVITIEEVDKLIIRLNKKKSNGAVFAPMDKLNIASDVYGLFREEGG